MNISQRFTTIAVVLFCLATTTVVAQGVYKMGFTIGSNYSSLSSDLFTTASGRLGLATGCSFVVGINDRLEFNQEILFTQKGADAKVVDFRPEDLPLVGTYAMHYNTFETGFLAGYKPFASLPFRVQGGGFLGTHFHNMDRSSRNLYVGDYTDVNKATQVVNLNEAFSGVDFGPVVGVSAGDDNFRVNARYYYGARNLYKNMDFVPQVHDIRTSSLRLTLTYFFKS